MRRWVSAMALALCLSTAGAQTSLSLISNVIGVGQWIVQSSKRVYYIEVEAQADNFEQARNEAFRLAVEQAVGTLILSETEARNLRIKRNDIVTYASGYVDRFEIVDRKNIAGQHRLRMRVWVAHSAIAGRLLHQQTQPREISGDTIAVQIQTFQHQQQSADRLLGTVMQDYPHRAFAVRLEPAGVRTDQQRQANLQVPFVVSWNRSFLDALQETLKMVNQYPACTGILAHCQGARTWIDLRVNNFTKNPGAWFNDDQAWNIMFANMITSRPVYRLTLNMGSQQQVLCFPARELDGNEYRSRYFAELGAGVVRINGQQWERIVLTVPLMSLPVAEITQVNVDIVRQTQCS